MSTDGNRATYARIGFVVSVVSVLIFVVMVIPVVLLVIVAVTVVTVWCANGRPVVGSQADVDGE